MGMAAPPRILPEGVPEDAEPVTEDQLERLPEYAQHLIQQFMELQKIGAPIHRTTREELELTRAAFFAGHLQPPTAKPEEVLEAVSVAPNNSACEEEEDGTDMRVDE